MGYWENVLQSDMTTVRTCMCEFRPLPNQEPGDLFVISFREV